VPPAGRHSVLALSARTKYVQRCVAQNVSYARGQSCVWSPRASAPQMQIRLTSWANVTSAQRMERRDCAGKRRQVCWRSVVPVKEAGNVLSLVQPMSLVSVREPFDHPQWLYEVKWDGFRALAYIDGHQCRLASRRGHVYKSGRTSQRSWRTRCAATMWARWRDRLRQIKNEPGRMPPSRSAYDGWRWPSARRGFFAT